jgi:hypothetical protein
MLAPETLNELDVILREEFGAELSNVEVFEIGTTLVNLFTNLQEMDLKDKQNEKVAEIEKNEHEETQLHQTI